MKKALTLLATLGVITLMGAGCAGNQVPSTGEQNTTTPPPAGNTTTSTTNTSQNSNDLKMTVQATGGNKVQVSWTVPADVDKTATFKVLHSARPEPVFNATQDPKNPNAFWFQFMNSSRSGELNGIPTGHRYFRLCVSVNNSCVKYSDTVEADVK